MCRFASRRAPCARGAAAMRTAPALLFLLTAVLAYYVYIPLPNTVSEPWKLRVVDALLRGVMILGNLAHDLGLSHRIYVLNFAVNRFEVQGPRSSKAVLVTDTAFAGVQVRVFESTRRKEGELKRAVIYLHGGGWALGSASKWSGAANVRSYDSLCRRMAEDLKGVVVSIDYRLAPEARFPEQYNDALRASRYFLQPRVLARYSVEPSRVGVSGDSAGGNLAAAVAQQVATDSSSPSKFKVQALIYPVLQALDFNTPSYQQNQNVPILYRPLMAHFWLEYLDGDLSFIQPLLANKHTALDVYWTAQGRAKVNWTQLLPASFRKHYKPVAPAHGLAQVVEEVPALLDPRAAPLLAERDVLARLPRTYILTCEHDVLRDDGLMYGRRLEEAAVSVTHDHYEDGFHGCMVFAFWPAYSSVGQRTVENYIRWLDDNL
ncbi:neutral cholesterol ester hydrolase 1-like isoform X3 [Scleropages formosus]|uniref:neutral cholesterol ester hydrolase 1-like isoform X3 n=1 Tax=Scleropages formosus TaxID=113540 RepID=UPI0010FA7DF5|nr:neutral cholesterol ester hydrolase 1-like isoform X3 [Scleropages formosus]